MNKMLSRVFLISAALASLTVCVLFIAHITGLLPDPLKVELSARARIAETLAVQIASAASRGDQGGVREVMKVVVDRNKDVQSIALRRVTGEIEVSAGDHETHWVPPSDERPSYRHVFVPLQVGRDPWGSIEIAYRPSAVDDMVGGVSRTFIGFIAFVGVMSLLGYYLLLRRTLKELDPGQVVPERVQLAFNTMAEGVLVLDAEANIVLLNDAFSSALQLDPADLLGRQVSFLPWLSEEDVGGARPLPWVSALCEGQGVTGRGMKLALSATEVLHFNVSATPILDDRRAVRGSIVTFNNVTELDRKNTELAEVVAQLRELSADLELRVAERTADATRATEEARAANINLAAENNERRRAERAVAESRDRILHQQAILTGLTSQASFKGTDWMRSVRVLTEACARTLSASRVTLWLGEDGTGTLRRADTFIVDRRDGEVRLPDTVDLALPEDFRGPLDPDPVGDIDSDPRLRKMRQLYRSHGVNRSLMCVPIKREGLLNGILAVEFCVQSHYWSGDEQVFATAISNLVSLVLEARDRQRTEIELRRSNAELEAATKAKSEFLANMSHEIRTPMNGVFGMTDLLSRTQLSERQRRLVETISQSAKSLLVIINDILDFSRIEQGRMELDLHTFDFGDAIEDSVSLLAELAHKKGLALDIDIDAGLYCKVVGDSGRLRQVMLNLVGNAIKFTDNGSVLVRVARMSGEVEAPMVRFEVVDTGVGIAPEVLSRLFQPFSQGDSSISRRYGGTGLGLSISQHLVSLMGGTINLTSEPGRGTRVAFELPLQVKPIDNSAVEGMGHLDQARIVVITHRTAVGDIIKHHLTPMGARVAAITHEEALGTDMGGADVVFLNGASCRDRDGIPGLISKIRERFEPKRLVWLTSMLIDRGQDVSGLVDTTLHKPIRRRDLLDVLSRPLAGAADASLQQAVVGRDPQAMDDSEPARRSSQISASAAAAPVAAPHSLDLDVLVVEDNMSNQIIMGEHLGDLGCRAVMVDNGQLATVAVTQKRFDIVLMDLQMPVMDGLTAARLIREREAAEGADRIPIVAVTANISQADREAVLAAGMDDHLGKPYSFEQLTGALQRWGVGQRGKGKVVHREVVTSSARAAVPATGSSSSSTSRLQDRLVRAYLMHAPRLVSDLRAALERQDLTAVQFAARSLASSSANLNAREIVDGCEALQILAASGDAAACRATVTGIEAAFARLSERLVAEAA